MRIEVTARDALHVREHVSVKARLPTNGNRRTTSTQRLRLFAAVLFIFVVTFSIIAGYVILETILGCL